MTSMMGMGRKGREDGDVPLHQQIWGEGAKILVVQWYGERWREIGSKGVKEYRPEGNERAVTNEGPKILSGKRLQILVPKGQSPKTKMTVIHSDSNWLQVVKYQRCLAKKGIDNGFLCP